MYEMVIFCLKFNLISCTGGLNNMSPSKLIRRAEESRRLRRVYAHRNEETQVHLTPLARPLPTNHASYSRLMRSHDRIRTRHLSKSGA